MSSQRPLVRYARHGGAALLCSVFGAACSFTSLDPFFDCPEGAPHCKDAPQGGSGEGGSSGNAVAGAEAGGGAGIAQGGSAGAIASAGAGAGSTSDAGAAGSAGSATLGGMGDPCFVDAECAQGTCYQQICGSALQVDNYAPIVDADSRWLKFQLQITNRRPEPVDLSTLTVRYYFTPEDVESPVLAALSAGDPTDLNDIVGTLRNDSPGNASGTYMEIGFKPGAGTLKAGVEHTGLLRIGIHGSTFSGMFKQDNDYSYGEPTRLPLYRDGILVSGSPK